MSKEMYFSVDVETDGPVPGLHSMLSIGIEALHPETLEPAGEFYATLEPLPEATQDPATMRWWAGFPTQYAEATHQPALPSTVMRRLDHWVREIIDKHRGARQKLEPIFVAYPVAFDFMFYAYYAHRFMGGSVFGFSGLDMGSLAMGLIGDEFSAQSKKNWPETWVAPEDRVAIHNALEDAKQQACIFRKMHKPAIRRAQADHQLRWFAGRASEQFAFSKQLKDQRDALLGVTKEIMEIKTALRPTDLIGPDLVAQMIAAMKSEEPSEIITMAAIRAPDGQVFVVPRPGRHANVIDVMRALRQPYNSPEYADKSVQGFVTDHGRFVDRFEGKQIARKAGQLLGSASESDQLYSEDVW